MTTKVVAKRPHIWPFTCSFSSQVIWRAVIVGVGFLAAASLFLSVLLITNQSQQINQQQTLVCGMADYMVSNPLEPIKNEPLFKYKKRVDSRIHLLITLKQNDDVALCGPNVSSQVGFALAQAEAVRP